MYIIYIGNLDAIPLLVSEEGNNPSIAFNKTSEEIILSATIESKRNEIVNILKKSQRYQIFKIYLTNKLSSFFIQYKYLLFSIIVICFAMIIAFISYMI